MCKVPRNQRSHKHNAQRATARTEKMSHVDGDQKKKIRKTSNVEGLQPLDVDDVGVFEIVKPIDETSAPCLNIEAVRKLWAPAVAIYVPDPGERTEPVHVALVVACPAAVQTPKRNVHLAADGLTPCGVAPLALCAEACKQCRAMSA